MQRSPLIPNRTCLNKRSRTPAYTSHLVTVPAGYNLQPVLTFFGCSPVTRVEPWCESCRPPTVGESLWRILNPFTTHYKNYKIINEYDTVTRTCTGTSRYMTPVNFA